MSPEPPLLETSNLSKHYGGVVALSAVDTQVRQGRIFSLIGPNGAGKTTLFNCLTGFDRPTEGRIEFQRRSLVGLRPDQITAFGLARTFQNIRLFSQLTVLDNVKIGRHGCSQSHFWGAIFRSKKQTAAETEITICAAEMLDFVGLHAHHNQIAGNLSYGDQRRLEIARALATEPVMLLLDEPAAGMNPRETEELMDLIYAIRERDITILLIEHDMKVVMRISDWVMVLDHGKKIGDGKPEDIPNNHRVIKAYLGKAHDA